MNRKTNAVITTACIGMAIGGAAYMLTSPNNGGKVAANRVKRLKKTTGRALRQVGDFIDNVSYMIK